MKRAVSVIAGSAAVVCAVAGFWYLRLPETQYRLRQDEASFERAASLRLKPGLSYEKVTSMLGPGEVMTGDNHDRWVRQGQDAPHLYPDGLLPSDMILCYPVGEFQYTTLCFRDGVLINFDPNRYREPEGSSPRRTSP